MWFNEKEKEIMGCFTDYIHAHESNSFKFIYSDGTELIVEPYLYEYESDNGLDLHEEGYEEYYEMAFKIIDIIKDDKNIFEIGKCVLVNYHTIPDKYEIVK